MKNMFITSYREKKLKFETDYVFSKYFENVEFSIPFKKEKSKYYSKYDILIDGIPYIICINLANEIYYIPKTEDLFKNDFDNIYKIRFSNDRLSYFSILRKENGIIESINYDFSTSFVKKDNNCIRLLASYTTAQDFSNELYKKYIESDISIEKFIDFDMINELEIPKEKKTVGIIDSKNGAYKTCVTRTVADMIDDVLKELLDIEKLKSNFEEIDLEKGISLIETAHNILVDEDIKRVRK